MPAAAIDHIPSILLEAGRSSAVILFLLAAAGPFSWLVAESQVSEHLASGIRSITTDPVITMLLINLLMLIVGSLLEPLPAMVIFLPALLPIGAQLNIDRSGAGRGAGERTHRPVPHAACLAHQPRRPQGDQPAVARGPGVRHRPRRPRRASLGARPCARLAARPRAPAAQLAGVVQTAALAGREPAAGELITAS